MNVRNTSIVIFACLGLAGALWMFAILNFPYPNSECSNFVDLATESRSNWNATVVIPDQRIAKILNAAPVDGATRVALGIISQDLHKDAGQEYEIQARQVVAAWHQRRTQYFRASGALTIFAAALALLLFITKSASPKP